MAKVCEILDKDTGKKNWWFFCPGCECYHRFEEGRWKMTGTLDNPTFQPSLVCEGSLRCHLFVRNGEIDFLPDCEHKLAGQKVPMGEYDRG